MEDRAQIIEVGVAEAKLATSPRILVTYALGSCLGIILYDKQRKMGGLAHPMLPDINKSVMNTNPAKFVNSAIELMLTSFEAYGSRASSLIAKIFGGATLFKTISDTQSDFFNIGQRNVEVAKVLLRRYGIEICAEDTGGDYGRTLIFNVDSGIVRIKTITHGEKEF